MLMMLTDKNNFEDFILMIFQVFDFFILTNLTI